MAKNGISYVGRIVNKNGQCTIAQSKAGKAVLEVLIAEDHQERNDRAPKKYQDPNKATDAYVSTTTSWHRVKVFEDLAEELATDPGFNHGALVEVQDAQYREEDPWEDKGGVMRAGRPETIGKDSTIEIFARNGSRFESRDEWYKPLWDGISELPQLAGRGGGGGGGREYRDDEGF